MELPARASSRAPRHPARSPKPRATTAAAAQYRAQNKHAATKTKAPPRPDAHAAARAPARPRAQHQDLRLSAGAARARARAHVAARSAQGREGNVVAESQRTDGLLGPGGSAAQWPPVQVLTHREDRESIGDAVAARLRYIALTPKSPPPPAASPSHGVAAAQTSRAEPNATTIS